MQVEIGIGRGERERPTVARPVAVPTDVPALHEHAVEPVLGRKVDVAAGVFGRGAVIGAVRPRPCAHVHGPPDADVFARLHPRHIAQLVRRVQVEHGVVRDKVARRIADEERPPRRAVRRLGVDAHAGRPRGEVRLKGRRPDAAERHPRVIDEGRFVDGDIRPAIGEGQRERCVEHVPGRRQRALFVQIFVPVPLVRADPPGLRIGTEAKGRQFVHDLECAEVWLLGPLVPKADAVVEDTEDQIHPASRLAVFLHAEAQLAVVIADLRDLAPRLRPRVVVH